MITAAIRTAALITIALPALMPLGVANAFAQADATAVADKLIAIMRHYNYENTAYVSATIDGDEVLIKELTATSRQGDFRARETRISNPVLAADGGLRASSMHVADIVLASNDTSVTIATMRSDDLNYPSPDLTAEDFANQAGATYASMEIRDIAILTEQNPEILIARIASESSEISNGWPHRVMASMDSIVINLQGGDAANSKTLGYDEITLGLTVDMRWDEAAGLLSFDKFELGGADVGFLQLTAQLGGVTRALLASTTQDQAMAHLQGLQVVDASMRLVNDSLVERIIAQNAADEGISPREMIDGTLDDMPDAMAFLGNPAFAAKAGEAARAFLKEPKSLTIDARPGTPAPVLQIFGLAMLSPAAAIELLKLEIRAND